MAKHYGAIIRPCPPRRGNRKGSVEAAVRYACGRWWRTMPAATMAEAQVLLDRFCEKIGDVRRRGEVTVGDLAEAEPLLPLPPVPYPATITANAPVDANATVAFRAARYSVPPGFIGAKLTIRQRLGDSTLEILTSRTGEEALKIYRHSTAHLLAAAVAVHRVGRGLVRTDEHRALLEQAVLGEFTTRPPCERKGNHPPGPVARAAANALRRREDREVRVDLARYAELVEAAR